MKKLIRIFWRVRYWLYDQDVSRGLREGRGAYDNPLRMEDLEPVMKMCGRLGIYADKDGVHHID